MPSTPETLKLAEVEEGVVQSLEHIHMDGAAIFNFTMEDVPPQVDEMLAFSGDTRESIEYFLFHQPNPFILTQMADKMKIPQAKLPNNIVSLYGNCSSVTIPLNIALELRRAVARGQHRVCFSGVWRRADVDFHGHGFGAAVGLQDRGLRTNLIRLVGETYTLITGAASGFGRCIAQKLAPSRKLLLADINAEKLEAVRKIPVRMPERHLLWIRDLSQLDGIGEELAALARRQKASPSNISSTRRVFLESNLPAPTKWSL